MIPAAWTSVVLTLGAFRVVRLIGWDDFPPIERVRGWVTGETVETAGSANSRMGLTNEPLARALSYRRPLLARFIACPFCQGFWVALLVYLAWLWQPAWTLYAAAPLALSAAVGLIAKNLDP